MMRTMASDKIDHGDIGTKLRAVQVYEFGLLADANGAALTLGHVFVSRHRARSPGP